MPAAKKSVGPKKPREYKRKAPGKTGGGQFAKAAEHGVVLKKKKGPTEPRLGAKKARLKPKAKTGRVSMKAVSAPKDYATEAQALGKKYALDFESTKKRMNRKMNWASKESFSEVSDQETHEALTIVGKAGMDAFFEKHTLRKLHIVTEGDQNLQVDDQEVDGVYYPEVHTIYAKNNASFVEKPYPTNSWDAPYQVGYHAASRAEATAMLIVHEMSHHLHLGGMEQHPSLVGFDQKWEDRSLASDRIIRQAYSGRLGKEREAAKSSGSSDRMTVSGYAHVNSMEYFAESHTAYVFHPGALKKLDSDAYAMVEQVRTLNGIPLLHKKP